MKIKNFTALLCMLFTAQLSFGQITLKHSYKDKIYPIFKEYGDPLVYKYLTSDVDDKTITIYNLDHSVYKVIRPEFPNGTNIYVYTMNSLYTNVVNTDPLIEFSCALMYTNSENEIKCDTYIMNEDGTVIKKIEDSHILSIVPTNDEFILYTYKIVGAGAGSDVYSLPTRPSNISLLQGESANLPYPNPAKQTIIIPYQLSGQWGTISIYNASGQFVEQKNVDKNFSNLLLDVSGYAKGMYYYKIDKQKGEFMVN